MDLVNSVASLQICLSVARHAQALETCCLLQDMRGSLCAVPSKAVWTLRTVVCDLMAASAAVGQAAHPSHLTPCAAVYASATRRWPPSAACVLSRGSSVYHQVVGLDDGLKTLDVFFPNIMHQ